MNLLALTRVTGIYGVEDAVLRGRFVEIVIGTPKREIRLRCDGDTDELCHSCGSKKRRRGVVPIVRGSHRVEWLWAMTNQQGFFDGLRIQLATKAGSRVFEFVSSASGIEVYEAALRPLTRLKTPNNVRV